jgi:hypothetical protein
MTEELKNKIRRERIREIVNKRIVTLFNKNDAYYKPMTEEKVKYIIKDDIIELRKKDCEIYLNGIQSYIKNVDRIVEKFKEMDIDEVLLLTYRYNLLYNIILYESSDDILKQPELTIDDLEKRMVYLSEKKCEDDELKRIMERCKASNDRDHASKKSWWNFF